jgi:hypothetical protein
MNRGGPPLKTCPILSRISRPPLGSGPLRENNVLVAILAGSNSGLDADE